MRLDSNTQNLLKRVGLNQYESAIYTSLLSGGVSTVGEVAETSRVPRSRVYDVLGSLEKKGFAIVQLGRPIKYSSVKPSIVIEKLKKKAEAEYNEQVEHYDSMGTDMEKELGRLVKKSREKPGEGISIIRGAENINSHIKSMIEGSSKRIIKITDEEGINRLHRNCKTSLAEAKNRGIKLRLITSNYKASLPNGFKTFADAKHNKKLKGKFFVKDGKESFIITSPETAVWVKSPYLSNSLEQLFEHAWEKGKGL